MRASYLPREGLVTCKVCNGVYYGAGIVCLFCDRQRNRFLGDAPIDAEEDDGEDEEADDQC